MNRRSVGALALCALMAALPAVSIVCAEETGEVTLPIPITPSDSAKSYAVYFADNMAFGPQWRVGNLIRIELMVLKLGDWNADGSVTAADLPYDVAANWYVNSDMDSCDPLTMLWTTYTQTDFMTNPDLILHTYMVVVPDIWVNITGEGKTYTFYASNDGDVDDVVCDGAVTQELNKMGHLIYGFQWDTEAMLVEPGEYKVSVGISGAYKLAMAVEHLYVVEIVDDAEVSTLVGYTEVPTATLDNVDLTGTGGVNTVTNEAFLYLGDLMAKSSSGSTGGGDNGDQDGGGGNMNGQLGAAVSRHDR